MATKKYRIEQHVELMNTARDEYRWTVSVHVDENDKEIDPPLCTASGSAKGKNVAASRAAQFTKWALKSYNLFSGYDDDDDDD